MSGFLGDIGGAIAATGRALGAPNLGISDAIAGTQAGSTAPGFLQNGVNAINNQPQTAAQMAQNNPAVSSNPGAAVSPSTGAANTNSNGGVAGSGGTGLTAQETSQVGSIQSLINQLNGQYQTLFGNWNQGVQTGLQNIQSTDQNQQAQLNAQYAQSAPQLQRMEAARGLTDSSYNADAQQNAGNIYNTQTQGITTDLNNKQTALQQQAASQLAQYQAQQQQLNYYGSQLGNVAQSGADAPYLLSEIGSQVAAQQAPLAGAIGSAQTPAQLQSLIAANNPSQIYNQSALQSLLGNLSGSSVPAYAQGNIASGNAAQNGAANGVPGILQQQFT